MQVLLVLGEGKSCWVWPNCGGLMKEVGISSSLREHKDREGDLRTSWSLWMEVTIWR